MIGLEVAELLGFEVVEMAFGLAEGRAEQCRDRTSNAGTCGCWRGGGRDVQSMVANANTLVADIVKASDTAKGAEVEFEDLTQVGWVG